MARRFLMKGSLRTAAVLLFAIGTVAAGSEIGRTRICVVAIHDSALFTMCPSAVLIRDWKYPGRTQSAEVIRNPGGPPLAVPRHLIQLDRPVLDRSRADWWSIVGKMPGFCPSGRIDLDLKREIEKEFSKRDDFLLVDSADQADLVFLAEGLYADAYSGPLGAQPSRYRSPARPMLALVMAIAVPARVYLRNPADSRSLLEAKLWEGAEAWQSNPPEIDRQPAAMPDSLPRLVQQFINPKEREEIFPALCAARILTPLVDGLGMPRTPPGLSSGKGKSPVPPANTSPTSASDSIFRTSVSLVTVPTIVSDTAGVPVPGLSAKDFHISENGISQDIDRVIPEITPFNVVLMLDTSGSTVFKHSEIQNAAVAFVEALRPEDRVMVVSFDSYIYLDSPFTGDRAGLRRAILRTETGAGTRLYDALDLVLNECLSRIQGRKAIVLFTDGMDSQSWLARFGAYQNQVEESDALVYAVQYDSPTAAPDSRYLSELCDNSGGRHFMASTNANLAEAFAGIASEIRHQYTICYYPANQAADTTFRRIRVTVDRPGIKIRARTGYRIAGRVPGNE